MKQKIKVFIDPAINLARGLMAIAKYHGIGWETQVVKKLVPVVRDNGNARKK